MAIVLMLIIGLGVGALARLIMPGKDPGGIIVTILIGIAGAVGAGLIGRQIGWYATGESAGMIASVFGAVMLLGIYRVLLARRTAHPSR
jgi:uncharacterized membrane protein YeaQ/YmgE (transglycosylase-associated protein family)